MHLSCMKYLSFSMVVEWGGKGDGLYNRIPPFTKWVLIDRVPSAFILFLFFLKWRLPIGHTSHDNDNNVLVLGIPEIPSTGQRVAWQAFVLFDGEPPSLPVLLELFTPRVSSPSWGGGKGGVRIPPLNLNSLPWMVISTPTEDVQASVNRLELLHGSRREGGGCEGEEPPNPQMNGWNFKASNFKLITFKLGLRWASWKVDPNPTPRLEGGLIPHLLKPKLDPVHLCLIS